MDKIIEALGTLTPYWPFVTQVVVLWYLGQVFKKRVWTKARASRNYWAALMRDTLPFHPLVAGLIWGALFPWLPAVGFVTTRGGSITQGLLAAALTVVGHTGLEHFAEARKIEWLLAVLRETVESESVRPPPLPEAARRPKWWKK